MSALLVAAYLGAIVLANLLVAALGPAVVPINALVLIGLDLTARDLLHERWQGRGLWLRMGLLIAAGGLISWLLNADAYRIALASTVAFVAAGAWDAGVYHLLRRSPRLYRINVSNVCAALIDSALFAVIAFAPMAGLLWLIVVQWLVKVLGGLVWSLILDRALPERQPAP